MKRILIPLLALMLCICACTGASAEGNVFRLEKEPNFVFEGETVQLALTVSGAPVEGEISFSSSNAAIASVDGNGLVTGASKGQATITATSAAGGKTYTSKLKITVGRKASAIEVAEAKLPLYAADDPDIAAMLPDGGDGADLPVLVVPVKKSLTISATVVPSDASDKKVVLTSGDSAVLQVKQGKVTGVAPGTTVLTVASEMSPEVAVQYRVLVVQPVKKLTVESAGTSVPVGGQLALTALVSPANATLQQVRWSSGDEKIATVDENGVVTGLKRGNGRIIAAAMDGSGVRASYTVKVVQDPTGMALSKDSVTVDVGKNTVVKATVTPANADNKKIIWTSSDERVATVSKDGRITGVGLGDCTVTAVSAASDSVAASVQVTVQQPVKKLTFSEKETFVYADESLMLSWTVEPANASNPRIAFTSSNERVATVDETGLVIGVGLGKATITAVTTDGSKRKAQIKIRVGLHVTGVEMVRKNAYLDLGETQTAGATIYPKDAANKNMTWYSSDESVVTASGKTNTKMKLKPVGYGSATVTGITEDGGYETSIKVHVGSYNRYVRLKDFKYDTRGHFWANIRNDTDLTITRLTAELEVWDTSGGSREEASVNTKNGSNKVEMVWTGVLTPGSSTGQNNWKLVNYKEPANGLRFTICRMTLVSYQIDHDWIKTIKNSSRPSLEY